MRSNVYSINHYQMSKRNEGLVVAKGLTWIALVMYILGIFLFIQNVRAFTLGNLGLMASFSLLTAGTLLFITRIVITLFIPKQPKVHSLKNQTLQTAETETIPDIV